MIDRSSALAGVKLTMAPNKTARTNDETRNAIGFSFSKLDHEIATHEGGGFRRRRVVEKIVGRALLPHPTANQKDNIAPAPPHLAKIMRAHHNLDARLPRH